MRSVARPRAFSIVMLALGLGACPEPEGTDDGAGSSGSGPASSTMGSTMASTTESADTTAEGTAAAEGSGTAGEDDSLPFPPAGPDAAPDPSAMGPYPVGVMTVELVDESRLDDMGQPRRLPTEIWYPAVEEARGQPGYVYTAEDLLTDEARALLETALDIELPTDAVRDAAPRETSERFPIVLFSHGSSGMRMQQTFLTVVLASHGYVVAAPDHIGNTLSDAVVAGGPSTEAQFASLGLRPDDMGFVLAYLQDLPQDDPLGAIIDDDRVGATGHSFGALTTLRLLAQGRPIDVAVAQAPPSHEIVWFGGLPVAASEVTVPVMLHAGELDFTTPLTDALSIYDELTAPRSLLTVSAAGHFTFSDMCRLDAAAIEAAAQIGLSQALEDGCTTDHISPDLALPLQRHFAIGLFNGHLRDSPGSLELLTAEAADALAPGMFTIDYQP